MKALLILIVTVGTAQANIDPVDSSLDVREIEFANIAACERAAERLTNAGRATSDWAKTFALANPTATTRNGLSGRNLFVSPPVIVAQCVELG